MRNFFKPEDFYKVINHNLTLSQDTSGQYASISNVLFVVNEKLNELIESWPEVYTDEVLSPWHNVSYRGQVFKARLAFIREIPKEPCKHEPDTYEASAIVEGFLPASPGYFSRTESKKYSLISLKCKHCGVELEAEYKEKN